MITWIAAFSSAVVQSHMDYIREVTSLLIENSSQKNVLHPTSVEAFLRTGRTDVKELALTFDRLNRDATSLTTGYFCDSVFTATAYFTEDGSRSNPGVGSSTATQSTTNFSRPSFLDESLCMVAQKAEKLFALEYALFRANLPAFVAKQWENVAELYDTFLYVLDPSIGDEGNEALMFSSDQAGQVEAAASKSSSSSSATFIAPASTSESDVEPKERPSGVSASCHGCSLHTVLETAVPEYEVFFWDVFVASGVLLLLVLVGSVVFFASSCVVSVFAHLFFPERFPFVVPGFPAEVRIAKDVEAENGTTTRGSKQRSTAFELCAEMKSCRAARLEKGETEGVVLSQEVVPLDLSSLSEDLEAEQIQGPGEVLALGEDANAEQAAPIVPAETLVTEILMSDVVEKVTSNAVDADLSGCLDEHAAQEVSLADVPPGDEAELQECHMMATMGNEESGGLSSSSSHEDERPAGLQREQSRVFSKKGVLLTAAPARRSRVLCCF
ncbi:unnamed protein product [Amoebophrya sp. A120]|nr:unnamed protein product [Amoebophrya sp. A120]|eukprot:GSA120T00006286001.1